MPVGANKAFSARIADYDVQGNRSAFSIVVNHTTANDTTPPAVPTALSATASFNAIYLSLTAPADADVSDIEIWVNSSSRTSGRTLLTTVNALPGQAARSAEHTSELQSLQRISFAVFCLNTKQQ